MPHNPTVAINEAMERQSRLCGQCCKDKADLLQWREKSKRGFLHEQQKSQSIQMATFPG
jgi:hypothetical protein